MPINGSQIIPSTRYTDAYAAIEWLCTVFGFTKHAVYGDETRVHHAELTLGGGMFMLGSAANGGEAAQHYVPLTETGGRETVNLGLIVEDCDAVHARAQAAGAEIVQALHAPPYGGKAFACRDLEGHIWWVGSYNPWAAQPAAEGTA